jgi:5'-deoxynucleotidase YfbR-like HD superfamily hydrolase
MKSDTGVRVKTIVSDLLAGPNQQMRGVPRYSAHVRILEEDNAQHSWAVSYYCVIIDALMEEIGLQHLYSPAVLFKKAILHDFDEAQTGDMPRPFKHSTPELRAAVKAASDKLVRNWASKLPRGSCLMASCLCPKDGPEGAIVELADDIAVVWYTITSYRMGNSFVVRDNGGLGERPLAFQIHAALRGYQERLFQRGLDEKFANVLSDIVDESLVQLRDALTEHPVAFKAHVQCALLDK